jgi:hypothetical protein
MHRPLCALLLVTVAAPALASPRHAPDVRARIAQADADARVEPSSSGYINAVQVYAWSDGALYLHGPRRGDRCRA